MTMSFQEKASLHFAMAQVSGREYNCGCINCKRAKNRGYQPDITPYIESLAILIEMDGSHISSARETIKAALLIGGTIEEFLEKKRQQLKGRRNANLVVGQNHINEGIPDPVLNPGNLNQGTGGGRRIIRSARGLS